MMKFKYGYMMLLAIIVVVTSCKKDNYKAPTITLKGRLVYNGEAINVEYDKVSFELYQPGFGKTGAIKGAFGKDGSYSTLLFAGNYKMIIPNGQGPFQWNQNATTGSRDTLNLSVTGDQTTDLNVIPYYLINDVKYAVNDKNVTANFNISKIITDANARNIESVTMYINKTQFIINNDVSAQTTIKASDITSLNNLAISTALPNITPTQNYVFVRVGLKIQGTDDLIFSPVQKIQL